MKPLNASSPGSRVKKFLLCLAFLSASRPLFAEEIRTLGFERLGPRQDEVQMAGAIPGLKPRKFTSGRLSIATGNLIKSILPYDFETGKFRPGPPVLEDLYYESLLMQDPVSQGEHYYPLIAQAIRHPADLSYVVFEINPNARFQDGSPVTTSDVSFSIQIRAENDPSFRRLWDRAVATESSGPREIRFDLRTSKQDARDLVAVLASTKIIKPNRALRGTEGSGVEIPYLGSGPYRLDYVSPSRLLLVKDSNYWNDAAAARAGLYHFSEVEILAESNSVSARQLLSGSLANFYSEHPGESFYPPLEELAKTSDHVVMRAERHRVAGKRLYALSFNLNRPWLENPRVRQALAFAFDFNDINHKRFSDERRRPDTLLEDSAFAPSEIPSVKVVRELQSCGQDAPPEAFGSVIPSGRDEIEMMSDHEARMLMARSQLVQAGFPFIDGKIRRPDGSPLVLNILVNDDIEQITADAYGKDLKQLGLVVTVVQSADDEDFQQMARSRDFDLIASRVSMLTKDGFPQIQDLQARVSSTGSIPCLDKLITQMNSVDPKSDRYADLAGAIARLHRALNLDILIGEARTQRFALDPRISVPDGFSFERAHIYGFWLGGPNYSDSY